MELFFEEWFVWTVDSPLEAKRAKKEEKEKRRFSSLKRRYIYFSFSLSLSSDLALSH